MKVEKVAHFCDYYKPLLVEEIALVCNSELAHRGKCSVIGKLAAIEDKLQSLGIPCFPRKMQLPDGTCSVKLDLANCEGEIPRGRYVEVKGIVQPTDDTYYFHNVLESSNKSEPDPNRHQQQPFIFITVERMYEVANPRELIVCNLRMRKLKFNTSYDIKKVTDYLLITEE